MSWLFPAFLTAGLLAALPIALHLLRARPTQPIPFPTLRFLGPSAVHATNRHRLRRRIVLALRCAAILLAAAAFARPMWSGTPNASGRAVVVVLDDSMSMRTRDRWPAARDRALRALEPLAPGDRAGVLSAGPAPRWLVPLGSDLERARAVVASFKPGFGGARYEPALRVAAQALADVPARKRTLLLAGDHQFRSWAGTDFQKPLAPHVEIDFGAVPPAPSAQASIESIKLRRSAQGFQLDVAIRAFAPEFDRRTLIVSRDGKEEHRRDLELKEGATMTLSVPLEPSATACGWRVQLEPRDALADDDTAWVAFNPVSALSVALFPSAERPPERDFLRHALGLVSTPDGAPRLPRLEADWPARGLAILRGRDPWLDGGASCEAFLGAGGAAWLLLDGDPGAVAWLQRKGIAVRPIEAGSGSTLTLRDWAPGHALLDPFEGESLLPLLRAEFRRGWSLEGDALDPVAHWSDGTVAIAEWRGAGGRVLLTGFDDSAERSDWPLRAAFAPFAVNAVSVLVGSGAGASDQSIVGSPIEFGSPGEWRRIDRDVTPLQTVSARVRPDRPGLYEFRAGPHRRLFAVNIDAAESDLRPWPAPDWDRLISREPRPVASQERGSGILPFFPEDRTWWWLLAGMFLVLMSELALANRTAL